MHDDLLSRYIVEWPGLLALVQVKVSIYPLEVLDTSENSGSLKRLPPTGYFNSHVCSGECGLVARLVKVELTSGPPVFLGN
jgi:hypothetical protein